MRVIVGINLTFLKKSQNIHKAAYFFTQIRYLYVDTLIQREINVGAKDVQYINKISVRRQIFNIDDLRTFPHTEHARGRNPAHLIFQLDLNTDGPGIQLMLTASFGLPLTTDN